MARWTRVVRDEVTRTWRVVCPVHGQLSRYGNFWSASRDAAQHDQTCPDPESPPDQP